MGGPQAFLWLPHPLRGHLPSPRFGWWGYASTSLCPPSQKDARIYVPDATSSKRAQGLRRPSCHFYSPDCVEWVFEEVRRVPVQHVWACRTTVQLSCRQYPSVVLRCPYELDPYLRTQPLQEGFRLGGHLGGFLHVHDEVSASGAVHVGEVGRLGLQVLHDGLEGLGEPSFLDERVGLLGRYAGTYQEAHVFAPPLPASVKRVEPFHCKA